MQLQCWLRDLLLRNWLQPMQSCALRQPQCVAPNARRAAPACRAAGLCLFALAVLCTCVRLQVSRSFGDAQFKGSGCSAVPAVTAFTVGPREAFLLAGCDGFWSVMDAQGAVDLVQAQLGRGKDPKAVTNRCGP